MSLILIRLYLNTSAEGVKYIKCNRCYKIRRDTNLQKEVHKYKHIINNNLINLKIVDFIGDLRCVESGKSTLCA